MNCIYCQKYTSRWAYNAEICNHCPSTPIYYHNGQYRIDNIDFSFNIEENSTLGFGIKINKEYVVTYSVFQQQTKIVYQMQSLMTFYHTPVTSIQHAKELLDRVLSLKAFL